jgi:S-adenosylmethionine decarboxylase
MTGSTATFGDHYLVDLHGCDVALIGAVKPTEEALLSAATRCGSTIIEYHFHQFSPHGVSGVILIAESHISVHTWPENGFVAVDIFTSGQRMKPEVAIQILEEGFSADRVDVMKVARGLLVNDEGWRDAP